jgi:multidrug efflux pump subunit AcrA (membrane-fusion protein)
MFPVWLPVVLAAALNRLGEYMKWNDEVYDVARAEGLKRGMNAQQIMQLHKALKKARRRQERAEAVLQAERDRTAPFSTGARLGCGALIVGAFLLLLLIGYLVVPDPGEGGG